MKILFLYPYPTQEAPSQRFRFEQYLEILTLKEVKYKKMSFWNNGTWAILYRSDHIFQKILGLFSGIIKRVGMLFIAGQYDFIFIHRELLPIGPPILEWILANILRKKIIYDFDDAIWLPNTSKENKIVSLLKWHSKVKSICRWSYKVSCGNSFLADYARQFNSKVIINPTTIDTETLHNPELHSFVTDPDSVLIGWTGSHSTLPYLLPVIPIIESLWKAHPHVRLLIIADKDPGWNYPFIHFVKWNKETEIEDLIKIDIGIMPLPDEEWAKGKCGFKALQYMSLKKPAVVSPVGANKEIVKDNLNGFHCENENDWFNRLEILIKNKHLDKQMGERGRTHVIEHYSVTSNSSNFLSLFE